YSALVCSLTVCGDRYSRSAISRFVEPAAISASTSRSRSVRGGAGWSDLGGKSVIPIPTIRTALVTSRASRSFETNPEAPAARAAAGDMRPAPEIKSTRVPGDARRTAWQTSTPDSRPTKRSIRATSGSKRRTRSSASSPVRAARHRSTHGCSPSSTRKPQWTTSWSSTTNTRRRRPSALWAGLALIVLPGTERYQQPYAPATISGGAGFDGASLLERLKRGQAKTHPRWGVLVLAGPVVSNLQREGVGATSDRHFYPGWFRVLADVSQRLGQHRLGKRLDVGRNGEIAAPVHLDRHPRRAADALKLADEGRLRLGR